MVTLGKLTIRQVEAGSGGACDSITFVPTVLPKGIEPSTDPILLGRAARHAVSLSRRLSEAPGSVSRDELAQALSARLCARDADAIGV